MIVSQGVMLDLPDYIPLKKRKAYAHLRIRLSLLYFAGGMVL